MKNINIKALLTVLGFWAALGGLILIVTSLSEQQFYVLGLAISYCIFIAASVLASTVLYNILALTKFRKD